VRARAHDQRALYPRSCQRHGLNDRAAYDVATGTVHVGRSSGVRQLWEKFPNSELASFSFTLSSTLTSLLIIFHPSNAPVRRVAVRVACDVITGTVRIEQKSAQGAQQVHAAACILGMQVGESMGGEGCH
jgi:hypothetical protein